LVMNLVDRKDPILTQRCQDFDFIKPQIDPVELAEQMVKFMYEKNAIGLAANQVGYPYRVFAMRGEPENFVCFNPKIVANSEAEVLLEEGCLTFPGLYIKIKRPQHVRVRFTGPNGDTFTKQFTGMTARIFQHEMDHLDGVVFYNRANRYHRDRALRKWEYGGI
jgi:peptide deformylase